jgi:hypothetical protein
MLLNMIALGAGQEAINDYVAWMVASSAAMAIKVVNAGGIDVEASGDVLREAIKDIGHGEVLGGWTPAPRTGQEMHEVHKTHALLLSVQKYLATKPFDLHALHLFHLVVKHRSFTRAAREAGLSQSALTRQMQALESRLGLDLINRTSSAPIVAGKTWMQWYADMMKQQNVTGEPGNAANPSLDAMFLDNCYNRPRVSADYNRDGVTDNDTSAAYATATRTGIKAHFDYIRTILPDMRFQLGNHSDLPDTQGGGLYNSVFTPDYSLISPLFGVLDGGLAGEYFIDNATINGEYGSSKEWQERANGLVGFIASRNLLRFQDAIVTNAALNIYSVRDVTGDLSSADKQRLRFGAAFITTCSNGCIDDRRWLDWATLPLIYTNGVNVGWLGQAVDAPQPSAYVNGIYVREFDNGFTAVNPRNNGTKTFTLPVDTIDVESGTTYAASATITLLDRDGVFLVKD